jgi:hypothetical protein
MPAGAIHDDYGMGVLLDSFGKLVEHGLHGCRRNIGQDERHRFVARRTDGAEEIQSLMTKIAAPLLSHAFLEPAPTGSAGLTNSRFILKPDFDPTRLWVGSSDALDHAFEVFLKAVWAFGSARG